MSIEHFFSKKSANSDQLYKLDIEYQFQNSEAILSEEFTNQSISKSLLYLVFKNTILKAVLWYPRLIQIPHSS